MEDQPLLSICCITYNHEQYIGKAVEGFLMQKTNFPFELIIHDDASTDNTQAILLKYKKRYPALIQLILQRENQYSRGVKPLLQYVFPKARGKYIALCEGDDYWTDPFKVQKQVEDLAQRDNCVMSFHECEVMGFDGKISKPIFDPIIKIISNEKIINTYIKTSSIVFKNCIRDFSVINNGLIFSGDVALRALLSTKGNAVFLPFSGSVYRKHDKGIRSRGDEIENYNKWIISREIIYNEIKGVNKKSIVDSILKIQRRKVKSLLIQKKFVLVFKSIMEYMLFKFKY
ncbi:MAG: glycosyltransferase [Cyclobacterium sp.]|uniref:glycosyltransferase family 2 protein n=1 Tax=Cyclobacterium sp. TaxID=1966343 RepID=UPI003970A024